MPIGGGQVPFRIVRQTAPRKGLACLAGIFLTLCSVFLAAPARAEEDPWRWGCLCRMTALTNWPTENFVVLVHVTEETRSEIVEYLARIRLASGRRIYLKVPACRPGTCRSRLFENLAPVEYKGWIRIRIVDNPPYTKPGGDFQRHRVIPGYRFEVWGR